MENQGIEKALQDLAKALSGKRHGATSQSYDNT